MGMTDSNCSQWEQCIITDVSYSTVSHSTQFLEDYCTIGDIVEVLYNHFLKNIIYTCHIGLLSLWVMQELFMKIMWFTVKTSVSTGVWFWDFLTHKKSIKTKTKHLSSQAVNYFAANFKKSDPYLTLACWRMNMKMIYLTFHYSGSLGKRRGSLFSEPATK